MDFYLISYDIPDDRRRQKVANLLLDYGSRVQGSVFEVWLTARLHRELRKRLAPLIDREADSVRVYRLCAACRGEVVELGGGGLPEPPGLIVV